jgi:hypothetical protein
MRDTINNNMPCLQNCMKLIGRICEWAQKTHVSKAKN